MKLNPLSVTSSQSFDGKVNYLASVPFYFTQGVSKSMYYRFEAPMVNYCRIKNFPSQYLLFQLTADKTFKVLGQNFLDLSFLDRESLLKSKKFFGFLLDSGFTKSGFHLAINSGDYILSPSSSNPELLFSDNFYYSNLFHNRYYRRFQSSTYEIDNFISTFSPLLDKGLADST